MIKELFGQYNGQDVYRYTWENEYIRISILNWGCVIQKLIFDGVDVECGFDRFDEYAACADYYGATVGRYANRISNGKLKIGENEYRLAVNDFGTNCNHGGSEAFNRKIWNAEPITENGCEGIRFLRVSPDGENGFPGNLNVRVTFLLNESALVIHYEATTDKPTAVNMTNHSYFNIAGFDSGSVLCHTLKVNADRMSAKDHLCRFNGMRYDVKGTALDLSDGPMIGERIDSPHPELQQFGGYGHNYIMADDAPKIIYRGRTLTEHCVYACPERSLTIFSDKPCLQVYTANLIGGHANFKGNTPVLRRSAVALEPQFEPNSCNNGKYILYPGDKYDYMSIYRFEKTGIETEK